MFCTEIKANNDCSKIFQISTNFLKIKIFENKLFEIKFIESISFLKVNCTLLQFFENKVFEKIKQ